MKESKILQGIIASAFIIVLSAPSIASAANESELTGKSVKVNYEDLNVQKDAGAKVLYRRLQQASRNVCGVQSLQNAGSIRVLSEMQSCYKKSLTSAVAKVESQALSRIHEG
jgi:UrcA family protein